MDAATKQDPDLMLNFDLLTNEFDLEEVEKITGDSEGLPESIVHLIESIADSDNTENDFDAAAFEEGNNSKRFQVVSEEDLNSLASENNAMQHIGKLTGL